MALTTCQRSIDAIAGIVTVPALYGFTAIARKSVEKMNQNRAHVLWVVPTALVCNLVTSAVAVLAAAVMIVSSPVFLLIAVCQWHNEQSCMFWLQKAAMALFIGGAFLLAPIAAIVNTVAPRILVNLTNGLSHVGRAQVGGHVGGHAGAAARTPLEGINSWLERAGLTTRAPGLWRDLVEHADVQLLREFLEKQYNTANYLRANPAQRTAFAQQVVKLLEGMRTNDSFRDAAFLELHHANTSCHDRTAFAMDKLMTLYEIMIVIGTKTALDKALFAIGLMRKNKIEEAAAGLGGDPIETALCLQITLKDRLRLPTTTVHMLYPGMAGIDDTAAHATGTRILSETSTYIQVIQVLAGTAFWQDHLRNERADDAYEDAVEAVRVGTYASDDLRKADLARRMDALYSVDTRSWLYDNWTAVRRGAGI